MCLIVIGSLITQVHGIFAVVIRVLKNIGKQFENRDRQNFDLWNIFLQIKNSGILCIYVHNLLDQQKKSGSTIQLCLSDSILLNVSGKYSFLKLWNNLGSLYQSKSLVNKWFLLKNMYHLKMDDNDKVTKHLNLYNIPVSQ